MAHCTRTILCALGIALVCATRTAAQETLTLPAGGLYRMDVAQWERAAGEGFSWLAVTLPPAPARGVLYLDGEPLAPYRMISREEAARVWCFFAPGTPVSFGVSAIPERPPAHTLRILCINRTI